MNDVIKLWHDSALNPKFKTERKIIREIFYNYNEFDLQNGKSSKNDILE